MLFCKLDENGNAISYAIGWENICKLRPGASLPYPPQKQLLDEMGFGIFEPTDRLKSHGPLQKVVEDLPVKDGDVYKQTWKVVDLEGVDKQRVLDFHWRGIRSTRNALLRESDIYMLQDIQERLNLSAEQIQAWKDYRQTLRDFPATVTNPLEVTWPTKPE